MTLKCAQRRSTIVALVPQVVTPPSRSSRHAYRETGFESQSGSESGDTLATSKPTSHKPQHAKATVRYERPPVFDNTPPEVLGLGISGACFGMPYSQRYVLGQESGKSRGAKQITYHPLVWGTGGTQQETAAKTSFLGKVAIRMAGLLQNKKPDARNRLVAYPQTRFGDDTLRRYSQPPIKNWQAHGKPRVGHGSVQNNAQHWAGSSGLPSPTATLAGSAKLSLDMGSSGGHTGHLYSKQSQGLDRVAVSRIMEFSVHRKCGPQLVTIERIGDKYRARARVGSPS